MSVSGDVLNPGYFEVEVGKVVKFFAKPSVAAMEITAGSLCTGDTIHIKGHTTDLELVVESMQIEHEQAAEAKAGDAIGIKVQDRCRDGDVVYKVT